MQNRIDRGEHVIIALKLIFLVHQLDPETGLLYASVTAAAGADAAVVLPHTKKKNKWSY